MPIPSHVSKHRITSLREHTTKVEYSPRKTNVTTLTPEMSKAILCRLVVIVVAGEGETVRQ